MTDSETEVPFNSLTFDSRVAEVDLRIGDQPDRVKTPQDLLKLKGETLYLVISPFGDVQDLGTSFVWSWDIGEIRDQYNNILSHNDEIDLTSKRKYICWSEQDIDKGISIRDFNVIPNNYNNHCIFLNKDAAEAYALYRKLQYTEDATLIRAEGKFPHHVTTDDIRKMLEIEQQADGGN